MSWYQLFFEPYSWRIHPQNVHHGKVPEWNTMEFCGGGEGIAVIKKSLQLNPFLQKNKKGSASC